MPAGGLPPNRGTPSGGMPNGGSTILVVDDNEMNRDLLSRRLRRDGHTVAVAVHGRDALAQIEATPFDLVMLDIMMPEMNGYEVLARLKSDPALRHIPVIMITAVGDAQSAVRCIELGAEDHLPKPFDAALLRARVGASLAKKRLHDREQLYARSLERELEIGREIQAGFLPAALPEASGWELAARFAPARQVAGDFYDAFPLADGLVGLVVADVCGKGVGAALFMALFRTLVRAVAEQRFGAGAGAADGLCATVAATNDYIARTHDSANMFATLLFAAVDLRTGALDYVNAGHEPPVVVPGRDGAGRVLDRLSPTGPAVGLMPGSSFGAARTQLEPGDALVAFTDGVLDARGAGGAPFGEARLLELLAPPAAPPAALLDRVMAALAAHADGAEAFDDVTMLAARRAEVPQPI